jgi:hypothetical protein
MIDVEVMRSCILEGLRREPRTQYRMLERKTAEVARERGLAVRANHETHLDPQDLRRFREMVWTLVIEGVIAIGMNDANDEWPWLSLSEYGEAVVVGEPVSPYDQNEYLNALTAEAPLDDIERSYITQALGAFRHNLPDAAAVMLGAASEHLMIYLGERVAQTDQGEAAPAQRALDGSALQLLRWLHEYFDARKARLERRLREDLNTTFSGIAATIRNSRNDAGHPALEPVGRGQVFVNLELFIPYRTWVIRAANALPL